MRRQSNEREISLASGKGAHEALETAGFPSLISIRRTKEDLKRLIEEPFDVAFLCLHGKYGEDGTVQGLLDIVGILTRALVCGRARLPWTR